MDSEMKASKSVNNFSIKLHSMLANDKAGENLFYSPTSICIALAMTYAGAKGNTAKEVEQCMNWDAPETVHEMMKELQQSLFGISGMELSLANRLWAQSGFSTLKEFTKILKSCYQAEMGVVDFVKKTEKARRDINNWVEEKTNGKIKDLLEQGSLTPDTRLVLTNAVYFKGFWDNQFEETCTHDGEFKVTTSKKTKIKFMNKIDHFMYAQIDMLSCEVLELPYKANKVSMMILLPNSNDGLAKLEAEITADLLEMSSQMLIFEEVIVSLPKFKIDCQLNLKHVLQKMEITDLFTRNADLSGIAGNKDLFVSEVIHQAFVDVNEEGTEAAAATAVAVNTFALPVEEPPNFLADHPFLFVIKHRETGALLFVGRIAIPVSE